MKIDLTILNKDVQINLEDLEIEVHVDSAGIIERVTVDGQEPSEIESIMIRDNTREIEENVTWRYKEHEKYKNNELWQEVHG